MSVNKPRPLYSVWRGMKSRCNAPNSNHFESYGGRGIFVCERWLSSFQNFLDDMGPRPDGYTVERINNDGPYSPNNCRWATRKEQQRNQRWTRIVVIEGKTYKVAELAEQSGWKGDTIVARAALGLSLAEVVAPRRINNGAWRSAVAVRVANQRAQTHCVNGHAWSEENTRITPQGWKNCRACAREKMRRRNAAARQVG